MPVEGACQNVAVLMQAQVADVLVAAPQSVGAQAHQRALQARDLQAATMLGVAHWARVKGHGGTSASVGATSTGAAADKSAQQFYRHFCCSFAIVRQAQRAQRPCTQLLPLPEFNCGVCVAFSTSEAAAANRTREIR